MAADDDLAVRVRRIEDELAIRELVARYAEACDDGYDADALAALFTEDACWSAASADGAVDFGRHEGREAIRAFFASVSSEIGPSTLHCVLAPRVRVAPDRATATGRGNALTVLERVRRDTAAREKAMLVATYDHEYRNVDGRWLFSRLHSTIVFDLPLA